MSEKPAIDQYLIAICQLIIDEFNVLYADKSKDQLNNIANDKFTETDLVVRIGYPFKQMAHYTRGEAIKQLKQIMTLLLNQRTL